MNAKRFLSAALAAVQMSLLLAACGDTPPESNPADDTSAVQETTAPAETKPLTEEEKRALVKDDLPEKKFDGREYTVVTMDDTKADYVVDGENAQLLNDSIYARNRTVEERFNCELVQRIIPDDIGASAEVVKAISSGEDTHDVALGQVTIFPKLCTDGYFLDWYEDLPHVNLESPWYIGNAAEALSVAGHAYSMIGEFNLDVLRFTYCMYYNKNIAANYDLENIYTVVSEGRWTYDYLRQLSAEIYTDLNGDGKKGEEDLLCISGDPYSAVVTYQYAFDNPLFTIDADGVPQLTLDTEKANEIVTKLNDLYWVTPGGYTEGWGTGGTAWANSNLLVYTGLFQSAKYYRDYEFDFGIIPYPK